MIYNLATKIATGLSVRNYIDCEETEIVSYGLFSVISKIMYGAICLLFGVIFGCLPESAFFYISFLFIKKYAGGFHAETELRCFFLSSLSIMASIFGIYLSKFFAPLKVMFLCLAATACFIIAVYAPTPSKERPLDETECKRYKKISKIRVVILIIVSFATYILNYESLCISISIAIILESILLVAGKIKSKKFAVDSHT